MRSTVLFFDALVYVPAIIMFTRVWQGSRSTRTQVRMANHSPYSCTNLCESQHVALLSLLLQPALLLIDFGHFQYNSVMLGKLSGSRAFFLFAFTKELAGFTLLSINLFAGGHDLWGAFCFTLSLGFKQMSLYYAPAIGAYLLAKCVYLGPIEG